MNHVEKSQVMFLPWSPSKARLGSDGGLVIKVGNNAHSESGRDNHTHLDCNILVPSPLMWSSH